MFARRVSIYLFLSFVLVVLMGVPIKSQLVESTASSTPSNFVGRNVNMVSGTRLPFGDPWLQRQNEPSLAVSTRNPMHLFAGANDYRTIDIKDDFKLPGIEGTAAADAWLGVYESFDGGQSWITTLLPGFPQDISIEGTASPLKSYATACDPIVRAGANGLFYYCGIAFDRSNTNSKDSAVFVARYVDNNNLEKVEVKIDQDGTRKYFGPIQYVDTHLVATGNTTSNFIDMPNLAVDVPRKGALYGNVYVAYTIFSESNSQNKIMFQRSTDGGVTWEAPVQLSTTGQLVQRPVIAIDPIDLKGNTIYVAFRRFAIGNVKDGIVVVRSTDGGKTFSKLPDVVSPFYPFDQGTKGPSPTSFRTNSYPTMAVGDLGTVYVAWSQRQGGPSGQAKIMISAFKKGGLVWSTPKLVDPTYTGVGHQFMPSLTFVAWKLMLAWYDQRNDIALHNPNTEFIEDGGGERHTIDVRAAEGTPGVPPSFSPSIQLSRYLYVLDLDADGNPQDDGSGHYKVIQAESNPINYPLFQLGTVPFHGDYLEITPSSRILPPAVAFGFWIYNINPLEPTNFHTAWTDNRDVRPPGDGVWANYNAPNSIQDPAWQVPPTPLCSGSSNTGMRNQNIYTANINKGIVMGSPGNTKELDLALKSEGGRTFIVFIKNTTELEKTLNLRILQIGGVNASFDQFANDDHIQVKVEPYSSISTTVYVDRSTRTLAPVTVNAFEGIKLVGYVILNPDPTNLPLNDPYNPNNPLGPLWHETHDPDVSAPTVWNYDVGSQDETNPSALLNPRVKNTADQNYNVVNPRVKNEDVLNPRVKNESIVNNEVANPRVKNAGIENTALTDVTWTVTNEGNTTSAYTINIGSNVPNNFNGTNPPLIAQVLVYKVHKVPIDKDCQLKETHQDELMVNIANPRVKNSSFQSGPFRSLLLNRQTSPISAQAADLSAQDVTFNLSPGEQADVTFRVWDENTADGSVKFSPNMVSAEAVAEAVNTDAVLQGSTTPTHSYPPNPTPWTTPSPQISTEPTAMSFSAVLGGANPAPQTLSIWNSGGGTLSYSLAVDANWLTVVPTTGTSAGVNYPTQHSVSVDISGLAVGTYSGTITVQGPLASNNPLRIPVALTLSAIGPASKLVFTQSPSGGIGGIPWTVQPIVEVQDAAGQRVTSDYSTQVTLIIDSNPGSGELYGTTTVTVSAGVATFSGLNIDKGGWDYTLQALAGESGPTTAISNPFDIEGFSGTGGMTTSRRQHTETLLPGGKVLITGGHNGTDALASAEIYDPANGGSFTATMGSMTDGRYGHTATLLSNGTVLITGGKNANNSVISSAEIYNPADGSFTLTSGVMVESRYGHTATLMAAGGKVLISGGHNGETVSNSVEVYDPGTGTFSLLTSTLTTRRQFHTATLLSNGGVLVAGGDDGAGNVNSSAEIYDTIDSIFVPTGSMTEARKDHTATKLTDDTVLIAGGNTGSGYTSSSDIFDPTSGTFSSTTGMNAARASHAATLLSDGRVLIVGGADKNGFHSSADIFSAGSFINTGSMNTARGYHTATLLSDGKRVLIAGGYNGESTLASAEIFWPMR